MVGIGGKLQEPKVLQIFLQETSLKQEIYVQNLDKQKKTLVEGLEKKKKQ